MANGRVVVERLEMIHNSLDRSMRLNVEELGRRDFDTDYREQYITRGLDLLHEVLKLEDKIRAFVHGG